MCAVVELLDENKANREASNINYCSLEGVGFLCWQLGLGWALSAGRWHIFVAINTGILDDVLFAKA